MGLLRLLGEELIGAPGRRAEREREAQEIAEMQASLRHRYSSDPFGDAY